MMVNSAYDIGEKVFFKCWRNKEPCYIKGEIIRISVYKSKDAYNIRYSINYILDAEILTTDRWETELIQEDLAGFAMPKLLQVAFPPKVDPCAERRRTSK